LDNFSSFLGAPEAIPKRVMPFFFLIDTSKSMEGKKIGAVNAAIEEILPDLRRLSDSQADSEIRLAILKFSSGCEWVTPSLISLDSFDDWEPLVADGLTDLGYAFDELNRQFSENGFLSRSSASSGFYAPVIMLLSDGDPTDDWYGALKKLQNNKWYQSAIKIAIAIGEDANREVLQKSIRNPELLFSVNDISNLKKVVKFIAVTSSQIASTSAAVGKENPQQSANVITPDATEEQIVKNVRNSLDDFADFEPESVPIPASIPLSPPVSVPPPISELDSTDDVVGPIDEEDW